jgi:hypothetical protein
MEAGSKSGGWECSECVLQSEHDGMDVSYAQFETLAYKSLCSSTSRIS